MKSARKTKLAAKQKPQRLLNNKTAERLQPITLGATPKPRNPLASLAAQRKAGSHEKSAKAQRRAKAVALRRGEY